MNAATIHRMVAAGELDPADPEVRALIRKALGHPEPAEPALRLLRVVRTTTTSRAAVYDYGGHEVEVSVRILNSPKKGSSK